MQQNLGRFIQVKGSQIILYPDNIFFYAGKMVLQSSLGYCYRVMFNTAGNSTKVLFSVLCSIICSNTHISAFPIQHIHKNSLWTSCVDAEHTSCHCYCFCESSNDFLVTREDLLESKWKTLTKQSQMRGKR